MLVLESLIMNAPASIDVDAFLNGFYNVSHTMHVTSWYFEYYHGLFSSQLVQVVQMLLSIYWTKPIVIVPQYLSKDAIETTINMF